MRVILCVLNRSKGGMFFNRKFWRLYNLCLSATISLFSSKIASSMVVRICLCRYPGLRYSFLKWRSVLLTQVAMAVVISVHFWC